MKLFYQFPIFRRGLLCLYNFNDVLPITSLCRSGNEVTKLPTQQPCSPFHSCQISANQSNTVPVPVKSGANETLLKFMDKRLGITFGKRYRLKDLNVASHVLLNSIYMKADFNSIQKAAKLEDSFQSWLNIVYMHVWMLFVTLKKHDRDGKIMTKAITRILWLDVEARAKKIEDELEQHLSVRKQLVDYVALLRTSFLLYDYGILKSDATLATVIWTQIYGGDKKVDPCSIEALVHYIHYTLARLDDVPMERLILDADNIQWPLPVKFGQYD